MRSLKNKTLRVAYDLLLELRYRLTWSGFTLSKSPNQDVVVCMTSYPKRITHTWLALESLFRQSDTNFRLVLVLAVDQFPGKKIPRMLQRQVKKGLELLWVPRDGRSFDHIWPAYSAFSGCTVISVDDDKFFPPNLVQTLKEEAKARPGSIIGWRGWEIRPSNGRVDFGVGWTRASRQTQSGRLFMPPGNGSLYPPTALPALTGDYDLREAICPNADDVWYWAMARLISTPSYCLGAPNHRPVWRQSLTPALAELAPGRKEFRNVLAHFDMEKALLSDLEEVP